MILIEEFNCQLFPFDSDVVSMEIPEVFRYESNILFLKQFDTETCNVKEVQLFHSQNNTKVYLDLNFHYI